MKQFGFMIVASFPLLDAKSQQGETRAARVMEILTGVKAHGR